MDDETDSYEINPKLRTNSGFTNFCAACLHFSRHRFSPLASFRPASVFHHNPVFASLSLRPTLPHSVAAHFHTTPALCPLSPCRAEVQSLRISSIAFLSAYLSVNPHPFTDNSFILSNLSVKGSFPRTNRLQMTTCPENRAFLRTKSDMPFLPAVYG